MKTTVSLGLLLVVLLLSAELFIRLNPQKFWVSYRVSPNDKIVFELTPNYRAVFYNAMINAQGLNDRFYPLEKPRDTFRIAVVGDSTSFGWKVGAENSFPKILERLLNREMKGRHYEVINFSVPGYNTAQEYELIQTKVMSYHPDMVILVYCMNDTHLCNYIKPKITVLNYLYHRSCLIRRLLMKIDFNLVAHPILREYWFVFKQKVLGMFYYQQTICPSPGLDEAIYINGNPPRSGALVPQQYRYMLGYKNYRRHLMAIRDFLEQRHIVLVSCGFIDERAYKINEKLGIKPLISFEQIVPPEDRLKVFLSKEDAHLNIVGNNLVARLLYEKLEPLVADAPLEKKNARAALENVGAGSENP